MGKVSPKGPTPTRMPRATSEPPWYAQSSKGLPTEARRYFGFWWGGGTLPLVKPEHVELTDDAFAKLFAPVMRSRVNTTKDEVTSLSMHEANYALFSVPSPSYETSKQLNPLSLPGQNKFTRDVRHKGMRIVQKGHDIGMYMPHVTAPSLSTPVILIKSSCTAMFAAESVRMNKVPAACIDMPQFLMLTCGDPMKYPAFPTTSHTNSAYTGMSMMDIVFGELRTLNEVAGDIAYAIFTKATPLGRAYALLTDRSNEAHFNMQRRAATDPRLSPKEKRELAESEVDPIKLIHAQAKALQDKAIEYGEGWFGAQRRKGNRALLDRLTRNPAPPPPARLLRDWRTL